MVEIEEIEDSDPEEMDIDDFDDGPIRPAIPKPAPQSIINPANIPMQSRSPVAPQMTAQQNKEASKKWQCVYPVYFDKTRTRDEGRRVAKELAVENPLAREMAESIARMGLNVVFEPTKTHPKDWSNPGRCRVLVKEDGKAVNSKVSNKHHLYLKIAEYLRANPTTKETPNKFKIQGLPPTKDDVGPAIPRGWKMGTILPLHSPAASGGGISEDFFKDMMSEMQGLQGGGGGGAAAAPAIAPASPSNTKAKKDKKKLKG